MGERTVLSGWGRAPRSVAELVRPDSPADITLTDDPRGQLARGLGRSYGDAALNAGGRIWDTTSLTAIDLDSERGSVKVSAGVSYADLLDTIVTRGWFPPVTPGTKYVTMGGAIAADVHGKNHHHDGSLGHHVESITVLTGSGEVVEAGPGDPLFAATVGGMGLTGIILETRIRLIPIESPLITVDTFRTEDLTHTLELMESRDSQHRYSVAWVDLAHQNRPGRGVITFGDHAVGRNTDDWKTPRPLATVPDLIPSGLINRATVRSFNELWYRKAPRERTAETQRIEQFFYPLDVAGYWNRLYGKSGFIQYQMVVPFGREDVVEQAVAAMQQAPSPPALAVLKRLGVGRGLLSFPIAGWTLAVDFPGGRRELNETLDNLDRLVADAGGRIYLAKDSRMDPALLQVMYPELDEWRELAGKADPLHRFRSDLDRRLGLRGS